MCSICGHHPRTERDAPNVGPVRFWDPDDGWKIGTLCQGCYRSFGKVKPHPNDYAYRETNGVCDVVETDEDPQDALLDD
jgi:hypothetical protein